MTLDLDRSSWRRVKFGDVVRNVNENLKNPLSAGVDRTLGLDNLDGGELKIQRWGEADSETNFTRRVRPGQTLFGKRRAYQRKTAYAEFEAVVSGDILVFDSADPLMLDPQLLPFLATTDSFYERALQTSAGSLSPRTKWTDLAKYEFDLPPLDQQRRIADLLWGLEAHTRTMSSLLWQSDELRVSLASEICYENEPNRRLSDVLNVVRGGSPRPIQDYLTEADDGINWIKIGDVPVGGKFITNTAGKITPMGLKKTRRVSRGDLLLSNSMSFGRPYILDIDGCIHDGWLALSDVSGLWRTEYLYYLLRSRQVQDQFLREAAGSTVKNLNIGIVSKAQIPVPSLEYQDQALSKFELLEASIAAVADELRKLAELRGGLNLLLTEGGKA
jgi:type I restriction enzyme S subunit